jgi:flagellar biosynthetic protein FlhB
MAEEQEGEKKHGATERRLRMARERGQLRRSADLPKSALTILFVLAVTALGWLAADGAYTWMMESLRLAGEGAFSRSWALDMRFAAAFCVLLLAAAGLALLSGSLSGGWNLAFGLLAPRFEHLSPGQSWGQIFSLMNFVEISKSIVKIVVVGGAGLVAFRLLWPDFLGLAVPHPLALAAIGEPALVIIAAAAAGAAVLAGADVGIQAWLNRRSLRMTDKELKEELRESEGDPQTRARRRAILRRQARARQKRSVRTASVVVSNPTHFAVAVRYRRDIDPVPMVVAKGVDLNAAPILEEARQYGIPIVEAPPLARALNRYVEVDHPIPPGLYRAVAEVLAYIWRLDQWRAGSGVRPRPPHFPETLETTIEAARLFSASAEAATP